MNIISKAIKIFLVLSFFYGISTTSQNSIVFVPKARKRHNLFLDSWFKPGTTFSQVDNMTADWIRTVYQILKDTHEILTAHNIEYWIQGGTLLGAVRHGGIIPWDDDIDMNLRLDQEKDFLALKPIFEKLGYIVIKFCFGYKVTSPGYQLDNVKNSPPWLDIFFTVQRGNQISYDPNRNVFWVKRDDGPIYITVDELYPLKKYTFGEIEVYGPNNPIPFLNCSFGNDWAEYAYKWNHLTGKKEKTKLTKEDKVPAQPTGPLEDRNSQYLP